MSNTTMPLQSLMLWVKRKKNKNFLYLSRISKCQHLRSLLPTWFASSIHHGYHGYGSVLVFKNHFYFMFWKFNQVLFCSVLQVIWFMLRCIFFSFNSFSQYMRLNSYLITALHTDVDKLIIRNFESCMHLQIGYTKTGVLYFYFFEDFFASSGLVWTAAWLERGWREKGKTYSKWPETVNRSQENKIKLHFI